MNKITAILVLIGGCGDDGAAELPLATAVTPSWRQALAGDAFVDTWGHRLALKGNGNVTVAISTSGSMCAPLVEFSADGAPVWQRAFDPADPPPSPLTCPGFLRLAVDANDNIITIGYAVGTGAGIGSDIFLRKHTSDGARIWTRYHDGGAMGLDLGEDVTTDRAGNIIAAGAEARATPFYVPWLAKYTPDGTPLWMQNTDPSAATWLRVRTDGSDNIIALREVQDQFSNPIGLAVRKLDPAGMTVWETALPGRYLSDFAVHADGSTLVSLSGDIAMLIKLAPDGQPVFELDLSSKQVRSPDGFPTGSWSGPIAFAADGTIQLASSVGIDRCKDAEFCDRDPALLFSKLTADGEVVSQRLYEPTTAAKLNIHSLAVDVRGQIVFTGEAANMGFVAAIAAE